MSNWSGRKKFFVIGAGVIVGLLVLLIILGAVLPDPEESQTASPTSQPEQATQAPIPTLTPTPQDVVKCPSAEESAYFDDISAITTSVAAGLAEISRLSNEAGNNFLVTQDESWVLEVAIVLLSFQQIADEISALSPPQAVEAIHSDMLHIASSLRAVVPLYSQGVDNFDADSLVAASEQINELGRVAVVMTGKIEDFCKQ